MNNRIQFLMTEAGIDIQYLTNTKQIILLEKFADLLIQECIACCGAQADKKSIRYRFGLPIESNVKYASPEATGHHTQYGREYDKPSQ